MLHLVAAYVGIAGNKAADSLVKAAAKLPRPHLLQPSQEPSETEAEISWRLNKLHVTHGKTRSTP